ncbi:MAG: Uma2 family endonuclease [Bacteroidota bacterium]
MEPILLEIPKAWSNDELFDFCIANRNLSIERNHEGQIVIMSPAGGRSSNLSLKFATAIEIWNQQNDQSGIAFDSSVGFLLPNGAMRSPDAAWLNRAVWDELSPMQKEKFLPFAPDFVVEVRSPSDRLSHLQAKMQEWIDNGCQLAWLIDPSEEKVHIYRPDKEPLVQEGFSQILLGEDVLPGFQFDLSLLHD